MRPSVRAAFMRYTAPLEGSIPHFYADSLGLVTIALGVYMGVNAKGAESIAPAIKR